jgi:Gp19/Gp15/Gp42-like protein
MAGVVTPVHSPDAYANADDLAVFWKTLTGGDIDRANSLLKLASNRLRTISTQQGHGNMDDLVNGDPAYFNTVQWVVMEAAKRAMLTPTDQQPVNSFQQTAGPYSENLVYTNPAGDLWFKKTELHDLGLYGNQHLSSISTTQRDIYSPYPYESS